MSADKTTVLTIGDCMALILEDIGKPLIDAMEIGDHTKVADLIDRHFMACAKGGDARGVNESIDHYMQQINNVDDQTGLRNHPGARATAFASACAYALAVRFLGELPAVPSRDHLPFQKVNRKQR